MSQPPAKRGAVGAFGVMVLAFFNRRLTFNLVQDTCHTSAKTVAMIFFIIVSATCFAYVYRSLGGDDIVEHLIKNAGLDSWGLLILIMVITFMLGFFLDWIEITLIVLPVFAPLVAGMDFGTHIASQNIIFWFIVLMAINLQTSFLTPPFGFALFYLKGIAPEGNQNSEHLQGHHSLRILAADRSAFGDLEAERSAIANARGLRVAANERIEDTSHGRYVPLRS